MKKLFVLGMAALLLVAFAVPAMADVKIGGIIFTDFYYLDRDKNNSIFWGTGPDSFNNTAIQVPDITRLYARWTNEDNVGMYIELGIGEDGGNTFSKDGKPVNYVTDVGVNVRHAYGWWDINPSFRIMAGKSTTPLSPLAPSQLIGTRAGSLNVGAPGYGELYSGRVAQVRGTFNFSKAVRLEVALVDPNGILAMGDYGPWLGGEGVDYQTNTKIPRIDIGVPIYVGPVSIYPSLMYQHRTVDTIGALNNGIDNDVDTYVGSLGAKAGFGHFGIEVEGNYGQNWGNSWGNAGASMPSRISRAFLNTTTNEIEDATTYSFWVDLSYKIGPVTPHLMYGQEKTESKAMLGTACVDRDAKSQFWGISVPIDLAKGFRVRPEITFWDDGDLETNGQTPQDLGKYMIAGVQFQITF